MHFWPQKRGARVALLLTMAFAALQAILLASTVPPWWGPDEDYHWGYINYLDERAALPDPRKPFYAEDWNKAIVAMNINQFGMGPPPVKNLQGNPHAATAKLDRLPPSSRDPNGAPTRPVIHAPLFHISAAVFVKPFENRSIFTRIWIGRATNAFAALLIVFAAWLLAAQVFSRDGPRLFVAGVSAVQPMIAYATGTLTNDAFLIAFFTLSLAVMCRMIRSKPNSSDARWLGVFVALAILTKTSALALVPLALATLFVQWRKHPAERAQSLRSLAWTSGIPFALAGWFYIFTLVKYHSLLGNVGALNTATAPAPQSILHLPRLAAEWFRMTYSTYWSHFVYWEGARASISFYIPALLGMVGMLGFAAWVWRMVKTIGWRSPLFTQAALLLAAVLLILAPFFAVDMIRGLDGNGFMVNGGRFLLPAYPAAVVLFAIGIREVLRVRIQKYAYPVLALVAAWQGLLMWKVKTLDRYFGGAGVTSLKQELHRASFFRPEFITDTSLALLIAAMLIVGLAALIAGVRVAASERREARAAPTRQSISA